MNLRLKNLAMGLSMLAFASAMASCSSHSGDKSTVDSAKQDQGAARDEAKNDDDVFDAYISLKNALVNGDAEKAKERAGGVKKQVAMVKTDKMTPDEVKNWNAQAAKLNADLDNIQAAADIKGQREAFRTLSDDLLQNLKTYGLAHKTAYHDFCPMYDNGSNWLSETKEIKNPYYGKGDEMAGCGIDSEEIAPAK